MIEINTYIGPYIECSFTTIPSESTIYGCVNINCEKHKVSCAHILNFCDCCGNRLQKLKDTILVPAINQVDVIDELNQNLIYPNGDGYIKYEVYNNKHIYMCNNIDDNICFNTNYFEETIIQELDLSNSVNLFKKKYSEEIKHLENIYGKENIVIKFGLINEIY
jgi:hypothetical protein